MQPENANKRNSGYVEPVTIFVQPPRLIRLTADAQPPVRAAEHASGHRRAVSSYPSADPDKTARPGARLARTPLGHASPHLASRQASPLFSRDVFQHRDIQHRLCEQFLELGVLILQRPKSLGVGYLHPAEPRHPLVKGCRADPVAAAYSTVVMPASCSCKIPIICYTLNLLRFMFPTPCVSDSTHFWSHLRGARQTRSSNWLWNAQSYHLARWP